MSRTVSKTEWIERFVDYLQARGADSAYALDLAHECWDWEEGADKRLPEDVAAGWLS